MQAYNLARLHAARLRANRALDRRVETYMYRPPGRRPLEPPMWPHDLDYQASI